MTAIESLLKILSSRHAKSLIIEPGKAPALESDGAFEYLSMPPLNQGMVNLFASNVLPLKEVSLSKSEASETLFTSEAGMKFLVKVQGEDGDVSRMAVFANTELMKETQNLTKDEEGRRAKSDAGINEHSQWKKHSKGDSIERVMTIALEENASDIVLSAGRVARIRVGGNLRALSVVTDKDELKALLPKDVPRLHLELEEKGSCDFTLTSSGGNRYRCNVFEQSGGLAAALRPIRRLPPTLQSLNLPSSVSDLVACTHGLVLVTGQAGSGKSTTLAALVENLHAQSTRHIITLEDPIEYVYSEGRGLIHQREIGTHVSSFASGLRAALRESPDVILVGEMRDPETMAAAITAAETGHLVLSTLHAVSAEMALDRMIDAFPGSEQQQIRSQLSVVLRAVMTQFLLPSTTPPLRIPAYEILQANHSVSTLIREGRTHQLESAIQTGRDDGMVHLDRVLRTLLHSGKISLTTAREFARDPSSLKT